MSLRIKASIAAIFALILVGYLVSPSIAATQDNPSEADHRHQALPVPTCPSAAPAEALPMRTNNPWSRAHSFATGAGVKVAVIDTGIHPHPYLPEIHPIADLVNGDEQGALHDCDGHGTIVAGVLSGRGPLQGVAPDIELLSIKQTSNFAPDASAAGTLDSLAEAIELAIDKGAQVINISVVSCVPGRGQPMETVLDASLARAEAENVVIVAAAGNLTEDCKSDSAVLPAHSPTVLAVSASDNAHSLAPYSIPVLENNPRVSASGLVKFAASPRDETFTSGMVGAEGNIRPFEGTSFAAPVVSGTAALLKQRFPEASAAEIRSRITESAAHGTGNVDPYAALTWLPTNFKQVANTPVEAKQGLTTASPFNDRATQVSIMLLLGATLSTMLIPHKEAE
ncbi:type VII secretion-associated serine protease mycosin [Corynebacterium freiburgense]|uniref:type VII secretion-associated serine protease mycosin n=1 Tax=Corynebacterium freiburgense TaxID=556548 RepID=UPI00041032B4|nr:type VII secretion-associated serine protease mycosin [Corynebacterium freiburgense]WJZ01700.1 Subtilisin DY [Corynebacterium freiburgense]